MVYGFCDTINKVLPRVQNGRAIGIIYENNKDTMFKYLTVSLRIFEQILRDRRRVIPPSYRGTNSHTEDLSFSDPTLCTEVVNVQHTHLF